MKSAKVMVLAGILSAAAGCSSTDDFVGSWKFSSGNMNMTCPGQTIPPFDLSGSIITINEGSSSDLVLIDEGCSIKLSIDGDKASLDGSQTCVSVTDAGSFTLTYSTYNFTTSDGESARLSANGSAQLPTVCTVSGSGDLEKL
jgi:hypothetical protein